MSPPKAKKNPIDKKARRAELRKAIKRAAVEFDGEGNLTPLAEEIGVRVEAILAAISRAKFSSLMAYALEKAVGREHLKKEFLCPETFGTDK
jgi:hypothetical protein